MCRLRHINDAVLSSLKMEGIFITVVESVYSAVRTDSLYKADNVSLLTFKNRASYIKDGRTATLQMLHFIYLFSTDIST
jgi:hypothetical protein